MSQVLQRFGATVKSIFLSSGRCQYVEAAKLKEKHIYADWRRVIARNQELKRGPNGGILCVGLHLSAHEAQVGHLSLLIGRHGRWNQFIGPIYEHKHHREGRCMGRILGGWDNIWWFYKIFFSCFYLFFKNCFKK